MHRGILKQITDTINWSNKQCPNLTCIYLTGGHARLDKIIISNIERLTKGLKRNAPRVKELKLPVASNECCRCVVVASDLDWTNTRHLWLLFVHFRHLSDCRSLAALTFERTVDFDRVGLRQLSRSYTKKNLLSLHIGVFRHSTLDKTDVAQFFVLMKNLQSFSCFDEDRTIFRLNIPRGDKVLTYSVIRLALVDAERGSIPGHDCRRMGPFRSKLREIKVVDRQLKPRYLLESCPELTGLYLNWQPELAEPPYYRFHPQWFSEMVRDPNWKILAGRLTCLTVVFPATHTPNASTLYLSDFADFFANFGNLRYLQLQGAGHGGPLPLLEILEKCPSLKTLVLDHCGIYIPPHFTSVPSAVHPNMESFSLIRSGESIMFNRPVLTRAISHLLPNLERLELQPEPRGLYEGLSPEDIVPLGGLQHLKCLSVVVSVMHCVNNMPSLVVAFRKFKKLKNLVISWGRLGHPSYDNAGKIGFMMRWLVHSARAENADLRVNLSFEHHVDLYNGGVY